MTVPASDLAPWFDHFHQDGARSIGVLRRGEARRSCLIHLIASAQRRIDISIYHFSSDTSGTRIRDALVDACRRGVTVRLVVDSFGSSTTEDGFFSDLRAVGANILYFSRRWRSSYLIRNHQKLILIDDGLVMMGGFNFADSYLSDTGPDNWTDLGFVVTGPDLAPLDHWFDSLWDYTRTEDGRWFRLRRLVAGWDAGQGPLQWHLGGPTRLLSPWVLALRRDMLAGQRLDMVMAYFSPGRWLLRKMGKLARRGHLRLVLAGRSDNGATIAASRSLYGSLLKKGAQICEYQPRRLHCKLVIVDDVVYFGSSNFDVRSLFLNVEIMARVDSADFANAMRGMVDDMVENSVDIGLADYRQMRGWLNRVRWTLAWFVVGVVDYTVTRRVNFGFGQPEPYDGLDDDDDGGAAG